MDGLLNAVGELLGVSADLALDRRLLKCSGGAIRVCRKIVAADVSVKDVQLSAFDWDRRFSVGYAHLVFSLHGLDGEIDAGAHFGVVAAHGGIAQQDLLTVESKSQVL